MKARLRTDQQKHENHKPQGLAGEFTNTCENGHLLLRRYPPCFLWTSISQARSRCCPLHPWSPRRVCCAYCAYACEPLSASEISPPRPPPERPREAPHLAAPWRSRLRPFL